MVTPETDFPEERFQVGGTLWLLARGRPLAVKIATSRMQNGRPVVSFETFDTIEAVEPLAGAELRVPEAALPALAPNSFYHHQLVGLVVETVDGHPVGSVTDVETGAGGSRLVIEGRHGEVLVPLAADICVEIDVAARRIRIAPPEGLLELNAR